MSAPKSKMAATRDKLKREAKAAYARGVKAFKNMSRYDMLQTRTAVFSGLIGISVAALAFQMRSRLRNLDRVPPPGKPSATLPKPKGHGALVFAGLLGIVAFMVSGAAVALPQRRRKHAFLIAALLNTIGAATCIAAAANGSSGENVNAGMQTQFSFITVFQTLAIFTLFKAAGAYFWKDGERK